LTTTIVRVSRILKGQPTRHVWAVLHVPVSQWHAAVVAFEFHEGERSWINELHLVPKRRAASVANEITEHLSQGRQWEKISGALLRGMKLRRMQRRVRRAALESIRKKFPKSARGIYATRHARRGRPGRSDRDLAEVVGLYEIGVARRKSPLYPWIADEMKKIEPALVPDLIRAARRRGLMTKTRGRGRLTARGRRVLAPRS
jgi:hypothetical protein